MNDAPIEITPALDGARVLWRHWQSTAEPREGFIREFSANKALVRISTTKKDSDAGTWFRSHELRVEAVLDESKAPKQPEKEEKPPRGTPPKESDFGGPGWY